MGPDLLPVAAAAAGPCCSLPWEEAETQPGASCTAAGIAAALRCTVAGSFAESSSLAADHYASEADHMATAAPGSQEVVIAASRSLADSREAGASCFAASLEGIAHRKPAAAA